LDLRLNPAKGKSAASIIKTISPENLEALLFENSDEPFSRLIANAIMASVSGGAVIETTTQLRTIIATALQFRSQTTRERDIKKACQRCFQALRIAVNDEFGVLDQFLEKLPHALAPGAKVALLSFHSGEDRRVKKSFQHFYREGVYSEIASDPIRPSAEECYSNPRARSAKFRWAIKA
jgi:16S rRNA (cytosine1402-N4)-methyltransferase